MRKIDIHQVDAFTEQLFGGNPAGVVTNAEILGEHEMQAIAREMNLSETAFVLPPTVPDADVRLRFFTPTDEVRFCGHAAVGALFQLATKDMLGLGAQGNNNLRVETKAGTLPMTVRNQEETSVIFTAPEVILTPYRLQQQAFAEAFGIAESLINKDGTIFLDTNLNYVYIPTSSLEALGEQKFNFDLIRKNFGQEKVVVFCLFSNETIHGGSNLHARGLAPNVGVNEDPFTGSMQAGMMYAAKQNGFIAADATNITTEQGDFVGRPGIAQINHDIQNNSVTISARAVSVFSTQMELR